MIKILKIEKGTATISTRGLCRAVIRETGQVICDLETRPMAKVVADAFNQCAASGKFRAVVVPYATLNRRLAK